MRREYVIGAVALILAFLASFMWTRSVNKNGPIAPATQAASAAGPAAGGGGGDAPAMANVQATMKKAKDNPGDVDAQIEAFKLEAQIGRYPEAIEYLKQASKDDPKDFRFPATIGNIYFEEKDYPNAEDWYNRALQIKPDEPELLIELGATFIERNPPDPDKALKSIQLALNINPKNAHALAHLTEAYLLKKDLKSAEDSLNRIKAADPSNQAISTLQTQIDALKSGKEVVLPSESNN
ncbi:MAG TPA: tetratricopeptide repeat protein [Blastocatellia bacterium]